MPSPTALTMKYLRRSGYLVDVAERWIPGANIRRDLFHVIDLVAIIPDEPILAVQATSLTNVSARIAKAQASGELAVWLKTGHARFQVFGWARHGKQWLPKIVELLAEDLAPVVVVTHPTRTTDPTVSRATDPRLSNQRKAP
jgi:hypothetical protein